MSGIPPAVALSARRLIERARGKCGRFEHAIGDRGLPKAMRRELAVVSDRYTASRVDARPQDRMLADRGAESNNNIGADPCVRAGLFAPASTRAPHQDHAPSPTRSSADARASARDEAIGARSRQNVRSKH
jgi:hypothetical protein